jgi:hypothetical protein
MKTRMALPLILLLASLASAVEYPLQFAKPSNAKGLSVIGEQFNADGTVRGNISYYTQTCSRYTCGSKQYVYDTGTWDGQGNLISAVAGKFPPQPVLSTNGTEQVYAVSGTSTTGFDTRGFGFISTPASHYTWQTPNPSYSVIPDALYTFQVTLLSDGDLGFLLNVSAETVQTFPSGYYTPTGGTATVVSTDCQPNPVSPGTQCSVTIQYDPTTIKCTGSPYGYAYTNLTLGITSDAGNLKNWSTGFTITGVPRCGD